MKIRRLFDIPYYQLEKYPQKQCIGNKVNGTWIYYSTKEFIELANRVSLGLLRLGVKKGDKIALLSFNNRPEWNIMDIGLQQIGAINVPVYPTISPAEYEYIFNDSSIKYAFVGDEVLLKKVRTAQPKIPSLIDIYTFDEIEGESNWTEIQVQDDYSEVEEIKKSIQPGDLATIIYTSGTTGHPKGVMLSHNNVASNVRAVMSLIPLDAGEKALSFLPLCHVFERNVTYCYMAKGVSITYAEAIDKIAVNLNEINPHFFTTVPRLLEKVYEKVYLGGTQMTGISKSLFFWALGLTDDYDFDKDYGLVGNMQRKLADKLVYSKIRQKLGGNVKGIVTGAAACPEKMVKFFSAIGIGVREGYGLSETSPALAINHFGSFGAMMGTVGPIIDGVTVKIAEDGEILAKGPNIMMGYYNKPDKTAEVMDENGWFYTGDIGEFRTNKKGMKFLKITDRKKELLKTSGGKYVAPTPIESKCKESFLIEQMMVVGESQKFVSAIIVPQEDNLKSWCEENGIGWTNLAEVIQNPKVISEYKRVIDGFNPNFSKVEKVKKIALVPDMWDVSTGELTPTMKLKRRVILDKYKDVIAGIYS